MTFDKTQADYVDIIGFDLGHGETALARIASTTHETEPEMIEIFSKKSQITALGFKPEMGDLIGDQALKTTGISELHIGFKPLRGRLNFPDHQSIINRFIKKYLHILEETGQVPDREHRLFVVGAPSGWTDAEHVNYANILRQAGLDPVRVEKESRAAFLHLKESRACQISIDHLMKNVLIIDIGSSTTDFTAVFHLEERGLADFGANLGAELIDRIIFDRTLEHMTLENPGDATRLKNIFLRFPHFERQCRIACREGKEKYFAIPELYPSEDQRVDCSLKFRTIQPVIEFEPRIYQAEMDRILDLPVDDLNGKSWKAAFHDCLNLAKIRMEKAQPDLVILTGGASRMDWTLNLSKNIFDHAEAVVRGLEPEFTIAKGLARIGRIDLRLVHFRKVVDELIKSDELKSLVDRFIPRLIDTLSASLADELISYAIGPSLDAWRTGELQTIHDIQSDIEQRKKQFLSHTRVNQARHHLNNWLSNLLLPDLSELTEPICRQFDIPRSALDLQNRQIGTDVQTVDHPPFDIDAVLRNDEVTVITSMIAGSIIGMASGGTGLALFHLPVAGQAIAAIAGAALTAYGVEGAKEAIKNKNLPVFFRKWVLSDDKMTSLMNKQRAKSLDMITLQMMDDRNWKHQLINDVLDALKTVLNDQMQQATIWIR
ncbi:MAG: hypothetical protein WA151_06430 [Desulfatirhabdiaceae bacterium]